MECQFCKKTLSCSKSLKAHQKTAKYCLSIQSNNSNSVIIFSNSCLGCGKQFTRRDALTNHESICRAIAYMKEIKISYTNDIAEKDKKISALEETQRQLSQKDEETQRQLSQKNEEMQRQLKQKDEEIHKLEYRIEKYESQIFDIAKQPRQTTQTTHDSSVHINLPPLTREHLEDSAQFLSLDHIKKGFHGYAEYALEYPLKGLVTCTDYSRRKVKYNNDEGQSIIDPDMKKLCINLFKAIRSRNHDLTTEYMNEMKEMADTGKWDRTDLQDLVLEAITRNGEVIAIANGNRPDVITEFVKLVCSGLTSSTLEI